MKKRGLSGKSCRQKGHSFERWVAQRFREVYKDAKRHLEYQASEANGVDVVNVGPYLVQCKRNRGYAAINKIKEIKVDPIEGGVPILITKGDNEEPLVVFSFEHFLELLKKN